MEPKNKKIIALVGLMGVGKTTIGSRLAQKLKMHFIDCDREIEIRCHKTINEIFADHSLEYFRQIEEQIIEEIITKNNPVILSLGGGAFVNDNIRNLVKEYCVSIWLDADVEVILERIGDKTNRPLLNNVNKKEVLLKLLAEREVFYQQADLKVDSGDENHTKTVETIINKLKKMI